MADTENARMEAALAALDEAPAEAPAEQSEPAATDPAPTSPPPEPQSEPPKDPQPAAPTPVDDEDTKLLAELEARAQRRQARQEQETAVQEAARLRAENEQLRQQQSVRPADRAVEFMQNPIDAVARHMGVDPLEFYERFKQAAQGKQPAPPPQRQPAPQPQADPRLDQVSAFMQQQAEREAQRVALELTSKTENLSALEPDEQIERLIAERFLLQRRGYDITDGNGNVDIPLLVRSAEAREKKAVAARAAKAKPTIGAPNEAKAKEPPASDGARPPAAQATLSNDLAAQATGKRRLLSEQERMEAALRELG